MTEVRKRLRDAYNLGPENGGISKEQYLAEKAKGRRDNNTIKYDVPEFLPGVGNGEE